MLHSPQSVSGPRRRGPAATGPARTRRKTRAAQEPINQEALARYRARNEEILELALLGFLQPQPIRRRSAAKRTNHPKLPSLQWLKIARDVCIQLLKRVPAGGVDARRQAQYRQLLQLCEAVLEQRKSGFGGDY